ncbi:MAG: 4Fe-4S dicluster domain-containing protein [Candidatus Delongbacteria bacterium]|nr:4Fe-4S dicluster domain-containing protein [Candidatus Delongbacteria bacterium]
MLKATIKKDRNTAVKDIAKFLLDSGKISGVFTLKKFEGASNADYGLITDPALLDFIQPFFPIMPQNAGKTLTKFTKIDKPILVIIRPCEHRAFIEMVKREQGTTDNFIIITYTCGGVIPLKDHAKGLKEGELDKYWTDVQKSINPDTIRDNCRRCEHFYPDNSDILVSVLGSSEDSTDIYINNERTKTILEGFDISLIAGKFDASSLKNIIAERAAEKEKQFKAVDKSGKGLDGLVEIFGKCIGCRGCNSVCPICYCAQCDFASANFDYNKMILEKELDQKGALRLPPDTIFFHIGRMSHIAFSCVGCGQCSDVCPAGIPVGTVFNRAGESVAGEFDFVPGRSADEKIPVTIYKEQEFPELGE